MYRSILVPLDGSPYGEFAVPVAEGIAERTGARLHLVHVHVPLATAGSVRGAPVRAYGEWDMDAKEQEAQYLSSLSERVLQRPGIAAERDLLEGSVVETLTSFAAESAADLIVMTTHGRGPLARAWLGSVADGLARHATVPVLLVRPAADPEPLGARLFRKVLVPLDGSPLAEQILQPATALGSLSSAEYVLIRVVSPLVLTGYSPPEGGLVQALDTSDLERMAQQAEEYLEVRAESLRAEGLVVRTQVVVEMQPAVGILDFARESGTDLIAMATHGRTGFSRLLLGSVADKVLRGTAAPVLLYRPRM